MGGTTTQTAGRARVVHRAPVRRRRRMGWLDRNFPRLAVLPTSLLMLLVLVIRPGGLLGKEA